MADIILVEDSPSVGRAYAEGLRRHGHTVRLAADEDAFRALLGENQPDLLLLDIGLPGMDGIEILRELREEPDTVQLKVAILSNFSDRDLVHRALRLDAVDYVEKASITPALLADQVERWLQR